MKEKLPQSTLPVRRKAIVITMGLSVNSVAFAVNFAFFTGFWLRSN